MERSEPTLVPEWLKTTGSINGGGNTMQHSGSSSSHSDDHIIALPTRKRSSGSIGDYDSPRSSAFSDRTSSSYFNRSLKSNGSVTHEKDPVAYSRSYSSFGRNNRDRGRDKNLLDFCNKEGSVQWDHRDRNYSTPMGTSANFLFSRIENDKLRRSQTMIPEKWGEMRPKRAVADLNMGTVRNNNNHTSNNSLVAGGSTVGSLQNAAFERDFPSLGAEERQGASDLARVSSPGLSTAVQSLPMGTSVLMGADGWTSALAEVPVIIGSNSVGLSSAHQSAPASSATVAPSTMAVLNMAEALAQAPSRVRTPPQLSIETQRLEELAIKQSRQLIPMTPSMPKTSILNSEKSKSKVASRSEMSLASKVGQQPLSSQLVNHTQRGHIGKLHVLKATRENNGISPTAKDGPSPTNATNNPFAVAPVTFANPLRNPNNPKLTATDRKAAAFPVTNMSSMDKRPTMSQAQSRNDFFNLMRKKTSTNLSSAVPDPSPVSPSTVLESSGELITEVDTVPVSPQGNESTPSDPSCLDWSTDSGVDMASNGDACEESQRYPDNGEKHINPPEVGYPDEEEAAFLRSLGWDENAEEEALTEEEINAFYKKYHMKLKPSAKLCRWIQQQKLQLLAESHVGGFDSTSSDSESEA